MTQIVRLKSENFKRLKAIDITPDSNVVLIKGRNAQGKSSVLDSIQAALSGKGAAPDKPVRTGEKRSETIVETTDLIVTRVFSASGASSLVVQNREGVRLPSPQAVLEKLVGNNLAFDPQSFSRLDAKKQAETVRALVKLDFTALDKQKSHAFETRTGINRDLKALQARVDAMPRDLAAPTSEVDASALTAEVADRQNINAYNENYRRNLKGVEVRLSQEKERNRELLAQIAELQKQQQSKYEDVVFLTEKHTAMMEEAAALKDADVEEVFTKINDCLSLNQRFHRARQRAQLVLAVQSASGEADNLTREIERIDEEKKTALANAQFPIAGLSFDENGLTYQNEPFEQASTAEKIKVSMSMAIAMTPNLKIVLIRDGSTLDDESMEVVKQVAKENDAQIWIERVGDSDSVGIVIEDGSVLE